MPIAKTKFKLPKSVSNRLQNHLDRQDRGEMLTVVEIKEAKGLVELAEILSLLRLKSERIWRESR